MLKKSAVARNEGDGKNETLCRRYEVIEFSSTRKLFAACFNFFFLAAASILAMWSSVNMVVQTARCGGKHNPDSDDMMVNAPWTVAALSFWFIGCVVGATAVLGLGSFIAIEGSERPVSSARVNVAIVSTALVLPIVPCYALWWWTVDVCSPGPEASLYDRVGWIAYFVFEWFIFVVLILLIDFKWGWVKIGMEFGCCVKKK